MDCRKYSSSSCQLFRSWHIWKDVPERSTASLRKLQQMCSTSHTERPEHMQCFSPSTYFHPRTLRSDVIGRHDLRRCTCTFLPCTALQGEDMWSGNTAMAGRLQSRQLADGASTSQSRIRCRWVCSDPELRHFRALLIRHMQRIRRDGVCSHHANVGLLRLIGHVVLHRQMRPCKGPTGRWWSVPVIIQRVPHGVEPVPPSRYGYQSTVYMTLTRIRKRS